MLPGSDNKKAWTDWEKLVIASYYFSSGQQAYHDMGQKHGAVDWFTNKTVPVMTDSVQAFIIPKLGNIIYSSKESIPTNLDQIIENLNKIDKQTLLIQVANQFDIKIPKDVASAVASAEKTVNSIQDKCKKIEVDNGKFNYYVGAERKNFLLYFQK